MKSITAGNEQSLRFFDSALANRMQSASMKSCLQPSEWCRTWLLKTPQVYPVKMFFIPHSVSEQEWAALGYQAGIIFDRSRITHYAEKSLPDALRQQVKAWCQTVAAER
jgi:hypothetical protein